MMLAIAFPAYAGPPFLTDDPEPTDTGHWEIYAPLLEAGGQGQDFEASAGFELNYGPVPDLQLTLEVPLAFAHDSTGWRGGSGDIAASAKYRFVHNEKIGLQVAVFPGITLPTARAGLGAGRVTALLPVWAQLDRGAWSVFGGGGYAINPGPGNRDYWTGGIAVSRNFGERLLLGLEAGREGPPAVGERASTSLGLGAIYRLDKHLRLLASCGPTLSDAGGKASFHAFAALGWDY